MEYAGHVTFCGPNLNMGACSRGGRGAAAAGAGLLERPAGDAAPVGAGAGAGTSSEGADPGALKFRTI